jgi:quercetin 2,3-dioxygenase
MISVRKSQERGHTHISWLNSFHTFSFGEYYDPKHMGFSTLRVINEDTVQPGMGFGTHAHRDMEIISYVVDGTMEHRDSMGNGSLIKPGEIQRMSAGMGVRHSEFNHSQEDSLHFLQVWIIPNAVNITPSYEQKAIPKQINQLILIGSEQGRDQAITIHQDVQLYAGYFTKEAETIYIPKDHRSIWIQLIRGEIEVNSRRLLPGDGASVVNEKQIRIVCKASAEFLLFDLGA